MFIDNLYLITMLANYYPETITQVNDDYIIVDTTVIYKYVVNELSATMMRKISEIELLPPLENKADSFFMYLYANLIEPSVHIVRAHVRQDFKSSKTPALIIFRKDRLQESSNGESSPFVCI